MLVIALIAGTGLLSSCGDDTTHEIPPAPVCATPVFDPLPGSFTGPVTVGITCATEGATIRYTTDGSTPAEGSTLYSVPFSIPASRFLQARAWKSGYEPSEIASGAYTIDEEPCAIGMMAPAGGETLVAGASTTIRWESNNCGATVRIELLQDGSLCSTIAAETPNDGEFDWTVAPCGTASTGYRVRVTDTSGGQQGQSAGDFSIEAACGLQLISPNGGEAWTVGSAREITWTRGGACGSNVRIELLNAGAVCAVIDESTENDGARTWTAAACAGESGAYAVRITDLDTGAADESDGMFAMVEAPCALSVLAPDGGEVIDEGGAAQITWESSSCGATVTIELLHDGAVCDTIASEVENDGSHSWIPRRCVASGDGYSIRVRDDLTGIADESDGPFSIHGPAWTIDLISPNGGESWQDGTDQEIRWNANFLGGRIEIWLDHDGDHCRPLTLDTDNDGSFIWNAERCLGATNGYTVFISQVGGPSDESDAPFTIVPPAVPCAIDVTEPLAGSVLWAGETMQIRWTSTGCSETVRIDKLCNGVVCGTLDAVPNDGEASWQAGACCADSCAHTIRVTDLASGEHGDSDPFCIRTCTLGVVSPTAQDRWEVGSEQTIRWSTAGCGPTVRIDLVSDETGACRTIAAQTENDGEFPWTVDACATDFPYYTIRITDPQSGIEASSESGFQIEPIQNPCNLTVIAPDGSEQWHAGSEETIVWSTSEGCNGPVRIDLLCNGAVCATIAESTPNDGSHSWTPSGCCAEACGYKIRVTDLGSGSIAESATTFCICPPCAPSVASPNGGEAWLAGSTHAVTWSAPDCGANVAIQLLRDGSVCRTIAGSTPNDGSYDWAVDRCTGEESGYAIRIVGACETADQSDATFSIPECVLTITSPVPDVRWEPGSAHPIEWTSSDCGGSVRIELWKEDAFCSTIAQSTPDDGSFDWTAATCPSGNGCDYEIRIIDAVTNRTGRMDGPFCICPVCAPVIESPNGGQSWQEGSEFDIAWTPTACDAAVKLELAHDGSVCATIASSTPNDGTFRWTAARCGSATDSYRVIVTGLSCAQSDTSDANFAIPPMPCALDLISPDGGESWSRNSSHQIRWNTVGDCGALVKIELLRNGQACLTIAEATSNDGTYPWTAVGCDSEESGYTIRITELAGNKSVESNGTFSIPVCTMQVTSPNGGESWMAETARTITWDAGAACGASVRIELLRNGILCQRIDDAAPNTGTYGWTAENCDGHTDGYRIRVTDNSTGTVDSSDGDVQIPTPPCAIAVTAPNGGESWGEGSTQTLTWTASHCGDDVRIELLRDGSPCVVIADAAPNTGAFVWNVESCPGASGAWKVRVTDLDSQTSDDSEQAFAIVTSSDAFIAPQNLTVCRGAQNVEILVRGRNSQALQGYGVSLCYDTAVFTCVSMSLAGTRGSGASYFENNCGNGCARAGVIVSDACPPQIDAGDGPLLKLTLNVKEGAPLGVTTLDLRNADPAVNVMTRCGAVGVDPTLIDGRVTICGGSPR